MLTMARALNTDQGDTNTFMAASASSAAAGSGVTRDSRSTPHATAAWHTSPGTCHPTRFKAWFLQSNGVI